MSPSRTSNRAPRPAPLPRPRPRRPRRCSPTCEPEPMNQPDPLHPSRAMSAPATPDDAAGITVGHLLADQPGDQPGGSDAVRSPGTFAGTGLGLGVCCTAVISSQVCRCPSAGMRNSQGHGSSRSTGSCERALISSEPQKKQFNRRSHGSRMAATRRRMAPKALPRGMTPKMTPRLSESRRTSICQRRNGLAGHKYGRTRAAKAVRSRANDFRNFRNCDTVECDRKCGLGGSL